MNVKNCRVQVETVVAKVAAYNRGGQHMVKCLWDIAKKLEAILPDNFHYNWQHVGYTSNLKESNVSEYGPALCFVSAECMDDPEREHHHWMPIEEDGWKEAGNAYWMHNDFYTGVTQPSRNQLKCMAKEMPSFIAGLVNMLHKVTGENEEATEVLLKMLEVSGITEAEISP